jgi:hypothetical protein
MKRLCHRVESLVLKILLLISQKKRDKYRDLDIVFKLLIVRHGKAQES